MLNFLYHWSQKTFLPAFQISHELGCILQEGGVGGEALLWMWWGWPLEIFKMPKEVRQSPLPVIFIKDSLDCSQPLFSLNTKSRAKRAHARKYRDCRAWGWGRGWGEKHPLPLASHFVTCASSHAIRFKCSNDRRSTPPRTGVHPYIVVITWSEWLLLCRLTWPHRASIFWFVFPDCFFFFFRCKFTSLEPRNAGMPMVVNIFVKFCVRVMENKKIKLWTTHRLHQQVQQLHRNKLHQWRKHQNSCR